MRNVGTTGTSIVATLAAAIFCGHCGCAAPDGNAAAGNSASKQQQQGSVSPKPLTPLKSTDVPAMLMQAFAAFERKQYDVAMAGAERVLAGNPQGRGAAEANYLRGRVFEERAIESSTTGNIAGAKSALQSAREAYNAAMQAKPAPSVEGSIRAGIANVAYFQDDYATAIAEGEAAFQKIAEPQTKAWVLYRVGLSQQRFGSFPEADRTFAAVQQQFPGSEPARRSVTHQGARAFNVQVGVFATPANAQATLASLRSIGVIGAIATDSNGRTVVRVGPVPNYEQAKALRTRLAAKYPDAVIVP